MPSLSHSKSVSAKDFSAYKEHQQPQQHAKHTNADQQTEESTSKRPHALSISASFKNLFVKSPKLPHHPNNNIANIRTSSPPKQHQQHEQISPLSSGHSSVRSPGLYPAKAPQQSMDKKTEDAAESIGFCLARPEEAHLSIPSPINSPTITATTGPTESPPVSMPSSRRGSSRRGSEIRTKTSRTSSPLILEEGSIKVYEDGSHEHSLKPMKPVEKLPTGGLLSGFWKRTGTNVKNEADETAFSLLPEQNRMDFQRRLSIHSRRTFDEEDEDEEERKQVSKNNGGNTTTEEEEEYDVYEEDSETESEDEDEDEDAEYERFKKVAAINEEQLVLINKLTERINNNEDPAFTTSRNYTLGEKYGKPLGIIGKGSYGIVKLVSHIDPVTKREKYYAVKELKLKENETKEHFSNRLTSEFAISNSLKHPNIAQTVDLMKNSLGIYSEIMEFCSAGDLYSLIHKTNRDGLHYIEADCFMKQIVTGIAFIHSRGVAHCDIKPENILLNTSGLAKISDFGTSAVFRTAWEKTIHFSSGACGSEPYVAPEEFTQDEYDPRPVDVWAAGILYLSMVNASYPWEVAKMKDDGYSEYLDTRPKKGKGKGEFNPIESLRFGSLYKSRKSVLYGMLDPHTKTRLTASQILKSAWMQQTNLCEAVKEAYDAL